MLRSHFIKGLLVSLLLFSNRGDAKHEKEYLIFSPQPGDYLVFSTLLWDSSMRMRRASWLVCISNFMMGFIRQKG